MTAAIIPFSNTSTLRHADVAGPTQSSTHLSNATVTPSLERSALRRSQTLSRTGVDDDFVRRDELHPAPLSRAYPHIFDQGGQAGQAHVYIKTALNYARQALDAFDEPNLLSVGTFLAQVASMMKAAYPLTEFNESLGGVVAFLRRATLIVPAERISRSGLNVLVHVLHLLESNPMLDLEEASEVVDKLSAEGWCGEHKVVAELVAVLLDNIDTEQHVRQGLLSLDRPTP